jgi:signal transduction histidine kinase
MAKLPVSSLRLRILASVIALAGLSLFASTASVLRISEVNHSLDAINSVAVPLGKQFLQLEADTEVFRREVERRLGRNQWDQTRWTPKPVPVWLIEVLRQDLARMEQAVSSEQPWTDRLSKQRWRTWVRSVREGFDRVSMLGEKLRLAMESRDLPAMEAAWSEFSPALEEWTRRVSWGASEHERLLRRSFSEAQDSVSGLRTALEAVLVVVLGLSLLLIWLGERALRPLAALTRIARDITQRGLLPEDKMLLSALPGGREDEVNALSREFHRMATALLERGRMVEVQTDRLAAQNRMLEEMGALNSSILKSIEKVLIVLDPEGRIRQVNPAAARFLADGYAGDPEAAQDITGIIGARIGDWPGLQGLLDTSGVLSGASVAGRLERLELGNRTWAASWMPLLKNGAAVGHESRIVRESWILVLEEITDRLEIESRLRSAEHLAAIGRMSAQVAHEVRNPLHSIGLETELAMEVSQKPGAFAESATALRSALQSSLISIQKSVERLEKITGNYLKLSRLSSGRRERVDLGEVLEEVLASYAPVCEAQGVRVDWKSDREASARHASVRRYQVLVDRALLEQAIGNLFRNSLQAMEGRRDPRIEFELLTEGAAGLVLRLADNGPGISPDLRTRLFTPFVTSKAQGTGLGLSFARQVFEEHGGRVTCVESAVEGPGGAVFEMRLPLAPPLPEEMNARGDPALASCSNPEFSINLPGGIQG